VQCELFIHDARLLCFVFLRVMDARSGPTAASIVLKCVYGFAVARVGWRLVESTQIAVAADLDIGNGDPPAGGQHHRAGARIVTERSAERDAPTDPAHDSWTGVSAAGLAKFTEPAA
jgi:hypothetical protein